MAHMLVPISILLIHSLQGTPVVQWYGAYSADQEGIVLTLEARTAEGWHIYATELENDLGPIPTSIRFNTSPGLRYIGSLIEPEPVEVFDPNFQMNVRYHEGSPIFMQRVEPTGEAPITVIGEVEFMVCNDKTCLPPEVVEFRIELPATP